MSHAEMLRLIRRACVRAGMNLEYRGRFNPRPRISLPLPRPVGVETENDLLCIGLADMCRSVDTNAFKEQIAGQLPEGLEVLAATAAESKTVPQPISATYVVPVRGQSEGTLIQRIAKVLKADRIECERVTGKGRRGGKVDVRPFIETIEAKGRDIVVRCRVGPVGSIRVDEILRLFHLSPAQLAGPVRRTDVEWRLGTEPLNV